MFGVLKKALICLALLAGVGIPRIGMADYLSQAKQALAEGNIPYSIQLLHKSADLEGNSDAMMNLGGIYLQGEMAERNIEKGLEYFNRSVGMGNINAMKELGIFYVEGIGVSKDLDKAYHYWEMAYEKGDGGAAYNISNLFNPDVPGNKNPNAKTQQMWLVRAAEAGNRTGQYVLAFEMISSDWVLNNMSVSQRQIESFKWASLAAERGDKRAADLVLFMKKQYDFPSHVYRDAEAFVKEKL